GVAGVQLAQLRQELILQGGLRGWHRPDGQTHQGFPGTGTQRERGQHQGGKEDTGHCGRLRALREKTRCLYCSSPSSFLGGDLVRDSLDSHFIVDVVGRVLLARWRSAAEVGGGAVHVVTERLAREWVGGQRHRNLGQCRG